MSLRPSRRDIFNAFLDSLRRRLHNESVRASGRLLLVIGLCLATGIAGAFLIEILPAPAVRWVAREEGCAYNAELASPPEPKPAEPGAVVMVGWIIRNTDLCTWGPTVTLRYTRGNLPLGATTLRAIDYPVPPATREAGIQTGEAIAPLIPVTTPTRSGVYFTTWRLYADDTHWFGPEFKYTIDVGAQAVGAPPPRPGEVDWWFVVPAVLGVLLGISQAGSFVARMYSLKASGNGFWFVWATTFGLPGPSWWAVARNGELEGAEKVPAPPAKLKPGQAPPPPDPNEPIYKIGGPGMLFVTADTAVVLERGSRYARMLGPGVYPLRNFERVRAVYDLRIQAFSSSESAVTKDGIPVEAAVNTQFRFMRRMKDEPEPVVPKPGFITVLRRYLGKVVQPGESDPLPASPEALRLATYELPANPAVRIKWNSAAHSSVSSEVRDAMVSRYLDDLFAPDDPESHPRSDIARRLADEGAAALAKRGLELVNSGFGNITVPSEVADQRRNTWRITWKKESLITQSGGDAEGYLQKQIARAEAQAELIQSITQAIRTMGQTSDTGDKLHPLLLLFMDAIARTVRRTLHDSTSTEPRIRLEKALEQLYDALKLDNT